MPRIITNASKELPGQCISEEILWPANQSSQDRCNVYRMSLCLHCFQRYFAASVWCWIAEKRLFIDVESMVHG